MIHTLNDLPAKGQLFGDTTMGPVMKTRYLGTAFILFAAASLALGQGSAPTTGAPSKATATVGSPIANSPSAPLEDRGAWGAGSGSSLRFWATAEYLLWWTNGGSAPPLVTTGPALPINPVPGSLAAPGTAVLFGGDAGSGNPFSGGRFTLGLWCDDAQSIGVDASFFFLGERSRNFNAATSGAPGSIVLARPFFDTSTGTFNAELVGYPGLAAGSIRVNGTSSLLGAEANLLRNLCRSCECPCPTSCDPCATPVRRYRVDGFIGPRYMELREGLGIAEDTQVAANAPVFAGSNINAFDQFDTVNRFYGVQLGVRSWWWWNRMFINATGKVALGVTHQSVDIDGSTRITTATGATTVLPGNLFAQQSNIGHHSRDQFSVVPELGVNIGYQLTQNLSVFMGYTIIYWTNVQRPGDAINTSVNSTRVPTSIVAPTGPLDPQFSFNNSSYWAQGINFGVTLRY